MVVRAAERALSERRRHGTPTKLGSPKAPDSSTQLPIAAHAHELRDQLKQARDAIMRKFLENELEREHQSTRVARERLGRLQENRRLGLHEAVHR